MERQIRAVVFDVDGTMIQDNSWVRLNRALGISETEDDFLYGQYRDKEFSYQEWINRAVALYARNGKVHFNTLCSILEDNRLRQGTRETVQVLWARSYYVGIVSAGLRLVAFDVARRAGIPLSRVYANSSIVLDSQNYLKNITARGEDFEVKRHDLLDFCVSLKISPEQCIYVGDGPLDGHLFEMTRFGVTFAEDRCKDLHNYPHCRHRIQELPDLLKLL